MAWYYRYETKGIQRWILNSNRLRDLAGGSALIESITQQAQRAIEEGKGEVLYRAAGGVLARFDTREQLEEFASEWPMYLAYHAPGLQVVQAWISDEESLSPRSQLFEMLTARRNQPLSPLLEAGPWIERAGRSGLPAVPPPPYLSTQEEWRTMWDRPTLAKEGARQQQRQQDSFFAGLLSPEEIEEDLERWPEGAVAVIHADGSGIGKRIIGLDSGFAHLASFAQALEEATYQATKRAMDHLRSNRISPQKPLFLRPIVLGGDDLTLILTAAEALDFVRIWLQAFEEETSQRSQPLHGGLHAGAGIAFINRSYPFHLAYEEAESACTAAKADALDSQGNPNASVVRFQRITTALADDQSDEESPPRQTTWKLDQLDALKRLVAAARLLPRGSLRGWLSLLDQGEPLQRNVLWQRTQEVATPERWGPFAKALQQVDAEPDSGMFREKNKGSPLRDALMLVRLLKYRNS